MSLWSRIEVEAIMLPTTMQVDAQFATSKSIYESATTVPTSSAAAVEGVLTRRKAPRLDPAAVDGTDRKAVRKGLQRYRGVI